VAPNDRREKVMTEVNRPTFSKLSPPLSEICRFIAQARQNKPLDPTALAGCTQASLLPSNVLAGQRRDYFDLA